MCPRLVHDDGRVCEPRVRRLRESFSDSDGGYDAVRKQGSQRHHESAMPSDLCEYQCMSDPVFIQIPLWDRSAIVLFDWLMATNEKDLP